MSDKQKYRKPEKILADFKAVCRTHGYALAVHGNGRSVRDYDVIAVPWTPKAIEAGALLKALASVQGVNYSGGVVGKPHGRIGAAFLFDPWRPDVDKRRWIDISVTPRQGDW